MKENKFNPNTPNFRTEAAAKIAKLFPEVVADGQIDFEALQEALSPDLEIDGGNEKYEFSWRGKRDAKRIADAPARNTTLIANKEKSKSWDKTKNVYIEGENLEVLKILQKAYSEKVKLIYIDPPYNTGKDFIYHDDFHNSYENYLRQTGQVDSEGNTTTTNRETNGRFHTDWLNMMYPRLKVAWKLLKDDGFIFISIDDKEVGNLRTILNEVFGERNFVGVLSVENNPKGRKNSSFISVSSEYVVIYAKNKQVSYFIENVPKAAEDMTLDENGRYVHGSGKRVLVGDNSFNDFVSETESAKNYTVYYRSEDNSLILKKEKSVEIFDSELVSKGYLRYFSSNEGHLVENTYTDKKFIELFENQALEFTSEKIFEKNYNDTIRLKSQLTNKKYEAIVNGEKKMFNFDLTTTGAGTYLKNLFGLTEVPFSAPKNKGLLQFILTLIDDTELIVMDFFSGSSTTADAVMQQNSVDGGNRKFVMVQLSENLEENLKTASTEAKKSIKAAIKYLKEKNLPITLTSIAEERIRLAGERIISENKELRDKLDIGFRVFEFGNSTLNQWDENPVKFDDQLELLGISPFTGSSTNDERATEIAIKSGIPLDVNPTVSNDVYHYVSGDKEVFIVLGNYDESLFGNLDKKRSLQVATIVLCELEDGSELKFNLIESLKQNEILNNHLNVEWL